MISFASFSDELMKIAANGAGTSLFGNTGVSQTGTSTVAPPKRTNTAIVPSGGTNLSASHSTETARAKGRGVPAEMLMPKGHGEAPGAERATWEAHQLHGAQTPAGQYKSVAERVAQHSAAPAAHAAPAASAVSHAPGVFQRMGKGLATQGARLAGHIAARPLRAAVGAAALGGVGEAMLSHRHQQ